MPAGYRPPYTKTRFLQWSFAEARLRDAHNYWLCTTRADGRPHAVPVWGLWSARAFTFSTDPSSTKAKNIGRNPSVVVHVESGDEVVIVEGVAAEVALTPALDRQYFRKYAVHLIGFPAPSVIFRVAPVTVSAWREAEFSASTTRWSF